MALNYGKLLLRQAPNSVFSIACIPKRPILIPPNVGEPTRTNQEVIQALTEAIIGGNYHFY